jgi:hypothetical protein
MVNGGQKMVHVFHVEASVAMMTLRFGCKKDFGSWLVMACPMNFRVGPP